MNDIHFYLNNEPKVNEYFWFANDKNQ